jgi:hypothetical protein
MKFDTPNATLSMDKVAELMAENIEVCEEIGHDYEDAGGGMLICTNCLAEEWADLMDIDPSGRCDVYGSLDDE